MTLCALHHRLPAFVEGLGHLTVAEQPTFFECETIATGGSYIVPNARDTWASHMVELSLHGICARGDDEAEAIRNWTRIARAQMDQTPTPNNGVHFTPRARAPLTT